MKIMTCNIRYYGADDGENSWNHRKDFCSEVIRSRSPDIICFQEMWNEQLSDLQAALPGFDNFGMTDRPMGRNPVNSIFFRRELFRKISAAGYWLSETPHISGSGSWESNHVRIANWTRLENRNSQKEFRLINTHLDNLSQIARENGARLITEDAAAFPDEYPQILTGDMNSDNANKAIHIYKEGGWRDTYAAIHGIDNPGHTLHHFQGDDFDAEKGKIDWIFIRGRIKTLDAEVVKDSQNGRFPSDHYFVTAEVEL